MPGPVSRGRFVWYDLMTPDPDSDYEMAFSFYNELFGWEKTEEMDMGEMGIYQMFGPESDVGFSYGGMFNRSPEMPDHSFWLYYIMVPDMDVAVTLVKENGGKILNGPMEVPGGDVIAQCMDPQGAAFALHTRNASTTE